MLQWIAERETQYSSEAVAVPPLFLCVEKSVEYAQGTFI